MIEHKATCQGQPCTCKPEPNSNMAEAIAIARQQGYEQGHHDGWYQAKGIDHTACRRTTFTLPPVTNEQIVQGRMIDGPSLSDGIPRDDDHHHHWVMTNSALIVGQPPTTDRRYLCTTCKAQRTVCHQCNRIKGCNTDCMDMDCEHCYCNRDGRDG